MITQLEFRLSKRGASQNEKLRAYLQARPGQWIPMPELVAAVGSYVIHSRIADCRRLYNMVIEQDSSWRDGQNLSSYRYLPCPPSN